LALLLFDTRNATTPRQRIAGVRFARTALQADLVREVPAAHPVRGLGQTHRLILTTDSASAEAARQAILVANGNDVCWKFARHELSDLLRAVLHSGLLRPEFERAAVKIIEASPPPPPSAPP
jgi:hypothetical protein